jgi:hypothetical protein
VRKFFWLGLLFWMCWMFVNSIRDIDEDPMLFVFALCCALVLTRWHRAQPINDTQVKKLHAVIEEHHGNLYLYEKEKNKFLMQARTLEECEKFLSKHYENTLIVITSEDKKLIKKLKGTV